MIHKIVDIRHGITNAQALKMADIPTKAELQQLYKMPLRYTERGVYVSIGGSEFYMPYNNMKMNVGSCYIRSNDGHYVTLSKGKRNGVQPSGGVASSWEMSTIVIQRLGESADKPAEEQPQPTAEEFPIRSIRFTDNDAKDVLEAMFPNTIKGRKGFSGLEVELKSKTGIALIKLRKKYDLFREEQTKRAKDAEAKVEELSKRLKATIAEKDRLQVELTKSKNDATLVPRLKRERDDAVTKYKEEKENFDKMVKECGELHDTIYDLRHPAETMELTFQSWCEDGCSMATGIFDIHCNWTPFAVNANTDFKEPKRLDIDGCIIGVYENVALPREHHYRTATFLEVRKFVEFAGSGLELLGIKEIKYNAKKNVFTCDCPIANWNELGGKAK